MKVELLGVRFDDLSPEEMVHTGDIVRWQELLTKKNKVQKMQLHMN